METNLDKTKLVIWRKLSASPLTFNYIEVPICNFRITPCRLCLSNLVIFYRNSRRVILAIVTSKRYWTVFFFWGGGAGGRISTWNNCAKKNWVKKRGDAILITVQPSEKISRFGLFFNKSDLLEGRLQERKIWLEQMYVFVCKCPLNRDVPWIEVGLRLVNN